MINFNLNKFNLNKTAMAYDRLKNRPLQDYVWSNLDQGISPEVIEAINQNKTVAAIVGDAKARRASTINKVSKDYGIDVEMAKKLCQVWVGYHPKYGGFWTIIAPYQSAGLWYGKEHVEASAIDRFYLGTKTVAPMDPKKIQSSARKNIRKFKEKFGLEFKLDELELVNMADVDQENNKVTNKSKAKERFRKEEVSRITSLDPKSAEFKAAFPQLEFDDEGNIKALPTATEMANQYAGSGSFMRLNAKGYHKYLTHYVNEWYQKAIQEQVEVSNMNLPPNTPEDQKVTKEQVLVDALKNDEMMERLYKSTYTLLKDASTGISGIDPEETQRAKQVKVPLSMWHLERRDDGFGHVSTVKINTPRYAPMGTIPYYSDDVFKPVFGQQAPTGVKNSKDPKILNLKNEIRLIISKHINDPEFLTAENVTNVLNQHEKRQGKTQIPVELVDKLMDLVEDDIQKESESADGTKELNLSMAFPDMQSALQEAQSKFSQDVMQQDQVSKMMIGNVSTKMASVFSLSYNYTEQDLQKMRQIKEAKERGEQVDDFPIIEQQPKVDQIPEEVAPIEKTPEPPQEATLLGPQGNVLTLPQDQRTLVPASDSSRKVILATLKSLITIAKEMDNEGKDEAAEEIHKVIRKYQWRI